MQGAGIQNACLDADNVDKVWMRDGPEFVELEDKNFIINKAIYGIKCTKSSFISFIAQKLDEMGSNMCVCDPDVWRIPAVKSEGTDYSDYVITYVENIITVSMDAVGILEDIAWF